MLEDRQYDRFRVGDHVWFSRTFSSNDFETFAGLSGDRNPLHHDAGYAARTTFAETLVPLAMAAAPFSAIAGMMLPGHRSLVLASRFRAVEPVRYEAPIEYSGRIVAKHDASQVLELCLLAFQGSRVLIDGRMSVRVRADPPAGCWQDGEAAAVSRAADARAALVTGSSGAIGQAVSRLLARRGWKLFLQARDPDRGAKVAAQCQRAGAAARLLPGPLDSSDDRTRILNVLGREPPATALVHTASPAIDAGHESLVEVNYRAARDLCQGLLPGMLRRQQGRVVVIGSGALERAGHGWDDYAAAKQALTGYVRSLDRRYSPYGIRAATIAPGFVLSRFSDAWRPADAPCLLPEEVAEAVVDELESSGSRQGSCLRLEPGVRQRGDFGFQAEAVAGDCPARPPSQTVAAPVASSAADEIDQIVRSFFRLSSDADLRRAGIAATPGWDSLGHLQLLLHLESTLGIAFTSGEMSQAASYAELRRLVDAKLGRL